MSTPRSIPGPPANETGRPVAKTSNKTAKLFRNGRSQAVRLPREFRFEGTEVAIRRDPATGEVILSPAPTAPPQLTFDQWFAFYSAIPDDVPEEVWAKLPQRPKGLTAEQLEKVFDRAEYPEDFFERHTSMPRELDLF